VKSSSQSTHANRGFDDIYRCKVSMLLRSCIFYRVSFVVKGITECYTVLFVLAATSKNYCQNAGGTFRFELVDCLGLHRGALHIRLIIIGCIIDKIWE